MPTPDPSPTPGAARPPEPADPLLSEALGAPDAPAPPDVAAPFDAAAPLEAPAPINPVLRPRFCRECGAALAPDQAVCPACAGRAAASAGSSPHARSPLRATFALYFALLAVSVVVTIASLATSDDADPATEALIDIGASALFSLVTLIACIPGWKYIKPALARTGPFYYYPIAAAASVATYFLSSWLMALVNRWLGFEVQSYTHAYVESGYSIVIPFIMIAAQPAVFEELGFRGIIGPSLRNILDRREALVVTALLFAVLHLSPISFAHLFVIGLALGILRERSGSLYPGMVLHFCHNGLCVLSELYPEYFP